MRIKNALFFLLVVMLFHRTPCAMAEVSVYVMSRVETGGTLTVGDMASVDGEPAAAARIRAMKVKPELYADGFLDRVELESLIGADGTGSVTLYGGGVRVTVSEPAADTAKHDPAPAVDGEKDVLPGDAVDVFVKKNGIVLQTRGRAVEGGRKGDRINVRVRGSRPLKGTITDRKCIVLAVQ